MSARSPGFTLLESLIALLLLSMGLLGAWALMLSGLHAQADARNHSLATRFVRDLAERIRANPQGRAAYATNDPVSGPDCDHGQSCDPAQRANADLAHFAQSVHDAFPGPDTASAIEYAPATGAADTDRYAITLRWRGARDVVSVSLQILAAPVAG